MVMKYRFNVGDISRSNLSCLMGFDKSIGGDSNDQISEDGFECAWVSRVRVRGCRE